MRNIAGLLLIMLLFSCKNNTPDTGSFSGIWRSSEGTVLSIEKNGIFNCQKLPRKLFFPTHHGYASGSGRWRIFKSNNKWVVNLNFTKSEKGEELGTIEFILLGTGIIGNSPPWEALINLDVDDIEQYRLMR